MTAKFMLRIIRAKRLITVAIINILSGSLKTSKTYLLLSTSGDEIPSLRSSRTFSGDNKEAICWLNVTRLSPPRPPSVAMINSVPRKRRKNIRSASRNLQSPTLTKLFIKNACYFFGLFFRNFDLIDVAYFNKQIKYTMLDQRLFLAMFYGDYNSMC